MATCPVCHHETPDNMRFCLACGTALTETVNPSQACPSVIIVTNEPAAPSTPYLASTIIYTVFNSLFMILSLWAFICALTDSLFPPLAILCALPSLLLSMGGIIQGCKAWGISHLKCAVPCLIISCVSAVLALTLVVTTEFQLLPLINVRAYYFH